MSIKNWSTTDASNAVIPSTSINWSEGMPPSAVNNSARATMSDVRAWYQDAQWIDLGDTITYLSATQFRIPAVNVTATYQQGRRVRVTGPLTGTIYGTITNSVFVINTDVDVIFDSGIMQSETLNASLAITTNSNNAIPYLNKASADVASAATINLNAVNGDLIDITGITTITAITLGAGQERTLRFTGALILTNSANLVLKNNANILTAAGDYAVFRGYAGNIVRAVFYDRLATSLNTLTPVADTVPYFPTSSSIATTPFTAAARSSATLALLPRVNDVIISNNVAVPNSDLDFGAGVVSFSDGTGTIYSNAITKRLSAVWAVGSGNGGLDSGAVAPNVTYHCYVIYNPTSNIVDAIFSLNAITPTTLPVGYTKYRRVGSIITSAASSIIGFKQLGKNFRYNSYIEDRALSVTPGVPVLVTMSVPLSISVIAFGTLFIQESGGPSPAYILLVDPTTNLIPSASNYTAATTTPGGSSQAGSTFFQANTNVSRQLVINSGAVSGSSVSQVITQGWIDYQL